jgi:hypothetical protein
MSDSPEAIEPDILERLRPIPDRLAKEALDEIKKLRDALKSALDQRDLLAVKVSQWEASYVFNVDERESIKEAIVALRSLLDRTK